MKKIILFTVVICIFLINFPSVLATSPDCIPPFKTVEQAVICSGGTYGVIDTNNPDTANNFVQTVFDQGLTNNDGSGDCKSMTIRTGMTISCVLGSGDYMASYNYEGKNGLY